jgi:hypothetical protein
MLCRANSAAAQQRRSFSQTSVFKTTVARRSVAVHAGMLDNMLKKVVGKVGRAAAVCRHQVLQFSRSINPGAECKQLIE